MKKGKDSAHWIWKYIVLMLFLAAAVNAVMYLPIPTLSTPSSGDLLGFWGSFLGGIIGCIPAIAALLHSQAESKRLHEEATEAQRNSVLPVFSVFLDRNISAKDPNDYKMFLLVSTDKGISARPISRIADYTSYLEECADENKWIRCNLMLRNIGLGPALGPLLSFDLDEYPNCGTVAFSSLGAEQEILFLMCAPVGTSSRCKIVFSDIFGNTYSQLFAIHYDRPKESHSFIPASPPNLCKPE